MPSPSTEAPLASVTESATSISGNDAALTVASSLVTRLLSAWACASSSTSSLLKKPMFG